MALVLAHQGARVSSNSRKIDIKLHTRLYAA